MLDLSTLWRMPMTARWASVDGGDYIVLRIELTPEKSYQKLMQVNKKFATSIKNARGFKLSSKRSDVRFNLYKLFICHTGISFSPIEIEQDTESVSETGETEKSLTMYSYFMAMIQRFLTEVANEQQKL